MRRPLFEAVLIACILVSDRQCFAVKFNVDPPKLTMQVREGEKKREYITVSNTDSEEAIHVKSYHRDIIYMPDGTNDFPPSGVTPWTFADWVSINPTEFDLMPGAQQVVKLELKAPAGATGGRYGTVFFEVQTRRDLPKDMEASIGGSDVGVRIGTLILATVTGTEQYRAEILKLSGAMDEAKENLVISCLIENTSNVLIRPTGPIKVLDANGDPIVEQEMNPLKVGILPNTNKEYIVLIERKGLKTGQFVAQVLLDYGGRSLLGGQTTVTIE